MDVYQKAVEYFDSGEYNSASDLLVGLLEENKNDFDVLNFLGVINLNLGNYQKASEFFERVIGLYEQHDQALYNLGYCHQKMGNYDSAFESYEKILLINPYHLDTLNNLGVLSRERGDLASARNYYEVVNKIDPDNPAVINNIANIYFTEENYEKARTYYLRAVSLDQSNVELLFNLSKCLVKLGEEEHAKKVLLYCLEIKSDFYEARKNLAGILLNLGEYDDAIKSFQQLLKQMPDNLEAYLGLGSAFKHLGNSDIALKYYQKALSLDKKNPIALTSAGDLLKSMGKDLEAAKYFNEVLKTSEGKKVAFNNWGLQKMEKGNYDDAIKYWDMAVKEAPDLAEAHYNKAHAMLLYGNFKEGLIEYEWRKERSEFFKRHFNKPDLKERNITGKTVLIYDEQGLGDTIQFVRYLPMLKKLGAKIIFECDSRLIDLFKNLNFIDLLVPRFGLDENIRFDYHISLMSLPLYFNTDLNSVPADIPYLFADQNYLIKWENTFQKNNKLKIGLVWAGNPKHTGDKKRSIPLKKFSHIVYTENAEFYSLQKGRAVIQLLEADLPIINFDNELNSFGDTAALIDKSDLVISVDTSVAHLAAAMGKNTWLLLPHLPDWRWLLNRPDSPWYPTMKIFRADKKQGWEPAMNSVKSELEKLSTQRLLEVKPNSSISQNQLIIQTSSSPSSGDDLNPPRKLYLGLASGENYGWGVCSKYLRSELSNKVEVINIQDSPELMNQKNLDGKVFQVIKDLDFNPQYSVSGKQNYGYTFFENELKELSKKNAANYNLIFVGSAWGKEKLISAGINNCEVLIQGVDTNRFHPVESKNNRRLFVIFSGGKFELRKGQDIVMKAVKILQQKYDDIILVNSWYNLWSNSIATMAHSKYIKFSPGGRTWDEFMAHLYNINAMDEKRIFTLPLVANEKLTELYSKSDIGLFPNRCEGGTNLVLMEYMASGKPVIASYNSGHKDILTDKNSLLLKRMNEFKLVDSNGSLAADWSEPDLDEIITKVEYAYHHRDEIVELGKKGAEDMKKFTWGHTAQTIIKSIF